MPTEHEFEIDTRRIQRYFFVRTLPFLLILLVTTPLVLVGLAARRLELGELIATSPFWLFWIVYLSYTIVLAPRQVRALKYWLESGTLRIDEGVLVARKKSIPLDRITDIVLVQGPLMRLAGIWSLHVQTAGSTQQGPEGLLHGLVAPETVRNTIMEERETVLRKGSKDIET